MSPLVLVAAVLASSTCISAFSIRDFTRQVRSHQQKVEEPVPADIEILNATEIHVSDRPCREYYTCLRQTEPPPPSGSIKEGYTITPSYIDDLCRAMSGVIACGYIGELSNCEDAAEMNQHFTQQYTQICLEPGKSELLSFLPCLNKFEVQATIFVSMTSMAAKVDTIHSWPNATPTDMIHMMCWALTGTYNNLGYSIAGLCSDQDQAVYQTLFKVGAASFIQEYNCTI
ncbi:uncharacterized protein LOC132551586 [Ylistrum balloti]|uniref:uncharacterized protein LOC132551586 n=1 Tax=Ylistrum balloti TaxID=509963 RepID=UPI002905836A|nr:uncharacterized protein LOC132551586 [Ylistrum balloti]